MTDFAPDLLQLAEQVIARYQDRGWMIATAESCTGGLIAGALTEIAGSSAVVDRGFVTYSNAAKVDLLGVMPATLDAYGAVSRETALQMVRGALWRSQADCAAAVTGIAGPGGGSDGKPVGLVHLATASRDGRIIHRAMHYSDLGRDAIRLATVTTSLEMLLELAQA